MKDRNLAVFLALLLGWSGVHWAYLGKRAWTLFFIGVALFVVFSGYWQVYLPFVVVGFINGLTIASMNWHEFNTKYNR